MMTSKEDDDCLHDYLAHNELGEEEIYLATPLRLFGAVLEELLDKTCTMDCYNSIPEFETPMTEREEIFTNVYIHQHDKDESLIRITGKLLPENEQRVMQLEENEEMTITHVHTNHFLILPFLAMPFGHPIRMSQPTKVSEFDQQTHVFYPHGA